MTDPARTASGPHPKGKGSWYFTYISECPICGRGRTERKRRSGVKPEDGRDRVEYNGMAYDSAQIQCGRCIKAKKAKWGCHWDKGRTEIETATNLAAFIRFRSITRMVG